ncbi:MAG: phosphate signaling complex protein PhoU [Nitrososphaerales archaeon]|jgi:phosphate transport system protein
MRLMEMGLERLTKMVLDMATLSEATVARAIDAYSNGLDVREEVYGKSEQLETLQDEVNDLSSEMIARYQPVASDLRFITSAMQISYGFSRLGRYAYDISDILAVYKDIAGCDKSDVERASKQAQEMIHLSIKAFVERDVFTAGKLKTMDNVVDDIYRTYIRRVLKEETMGDIKCYISTTLVLRYLERIADHAEDVGESVAYTVTGKRAPHQ